MEVTVLTGITAAWSRASPAEARDRRAGSDRGNLNYPDPYDRFNARETKQRIRTVFAWAKAKRYRTGDNPVEGVSEVLPKHNKKKEHHAALPYAEVPAFILALRESNAGVLVRLAFEFLILTVTRTSECLLAKWSEIDIDGNAWTLPAAWAQFATAAPKAKVVNIIRER